MTDIGVNYTSLTQAFADLSELKGRLSSGGEVRNSSANMLEVSKGGTSEKLNEIYNNMVKYQLELIKLITLTEQIVRNIGDTFANTEVESMREGLWSR